MMTPAKSGMTRHHLLAAELYGYSYANYEDHLGNVRYDRLMPDDAATLERASREGWPAAKTASTLETDEENARKLLSAYQRAVTIVDAQNPAESFRQAVRFSIRDAISSGVSTDSAVEQLVIQVCFRAADLAFLLDRTGTPLSRYSRELRREPDVEYHEGYFDGEDASDDNRE